MTGKDANAVLSYFRRLADNKEGASLDSTLQGLAQLFDADAIGVTGMESTKAEGALPRPTADFLERLQSSPCAETFQDGAGHWLIGLVWEPTSGEPQLVWAQRSHAWDEADRWTWMVASHALMRWQANAAGSAMLQRRRLELAAQVTSRLSHDFGNILTGILGFTELSLTQAPAEGLLRQFLQEVLESAKHGADWIRRLHLFCRRGALRAWPTPLDTVLAGEETRVRSAGGFDLRWETDVPADLPLVDMDAGELQVVLAELVNNSREACAREGTITFKANVVNLTESDCRELLGTARPGRHVELTVADDGTGFAAAEMAKFGDEIPFSTKPRQRGLGLLIVYGCMQRYRGGFRVGPCAGKGTAMQLYLPIAPMPEPDPDAEGCQLLVVNANPLLLESMRKILDARGYRVQVAASAAAALTAFTTPRHSADLLIMDTVLPQTSGFDLARRLLDHHAKANFLFLHTASPFHSHGDEELAQRFPTLRWPVTPLSFLQAVQSALVRTSEK